MNKIYYVCRNLLICVILASVFWFGRYEKDYLEYVIKSDKCIKLDAIVEQIETEWVEGKKYDKYIKMSTISYRINGETCSGKLETDIRDKVGKKITIIFLPSGKMVRGGLFFSKDMVTYMPFFCLLMVGFSCFARMRKEAGELVISNKGDTILQETSTKNRDSRQSVNRDSKEYFKTANAVINIILIIIIVGAVILVSMRDYLWEKGWLY